MSHDLPHARLGLGALTALALLVACGRQPRTPEGAEAAPGEAVAQRDAEGPWEAAHRAGANFRAIGQEPGWTLEIYDGDRIVLVTDYGDTRAITPAPAPDVDRDTGRRLYRSRTDQHELTVLIEERPCTDVMSGESFPSTVVATLDGREYRGCGRQII